MNRKSNVIKLYLFIVPVLSISSFLYSCKNDRRNSTHLQVPVSSINNGESLSKKYCQSCHLLPSPSLLDPKSWQSVLAEMGPRLGIFKFGYEVYPSHRRDRMLDTNYYPSQPMLTLREWQDIINYFVATSPDSLSPQKREHQIIKGLPLFTAGIPAGLYPNAATSYIKIVENDTVHPLIFSDAIKQNVYFLNDKLQITDSVHTRGAVVNIDFTGKHILTCNIGLLNPNNGKFGTGHFLTMNAKGKMQEDSIAVVDSLERPVQLTSADLNGDGKDDLLICEFGFLTGSLSWMENTGNDTYQRHILRHLSGAIGAYIQDYNHDGLPDIWVLFAQGEEGIFLFTNKGHGNFVQEEVLRFPPVYGSSSFELADFNRDGYSDILYTCGDNADYSLILKPYHGTYIFINDKTNHFVQKFFFPINGCYKAIARDFDNDGDLDIATISFFADYLHQPEEGFLYLKNMNNFSFLPYSMEETKVGRWLVMDAGDIDKDGKIDIVLGNFSIKSAFNKPNTEWIKAAPYLVLYNTGK